MPPYDPTSRDDIAQLLAEQRNLAGNPLASGVAGLGAGYGGASPMTGPTLAGLPQTPAGGVPGAGIGAAGPSNLALPQRPAGMQGAMPTMGSLGAGMGGGQMTGVPPPQMAQPVMPPPMPQARPGMLGDMGGTGQMSDFENAAAGPRMGRRRGY
jgi:hypothetical protein